LLGIAPLLLKLRLKSLKLDREASVLLEQVPYRRGENILLTWWPLLSQGHV
jgi:hypothetical protein